MSVIAERRLAERESQTQRLCKGCGEPFEQQVWNQTRCKPKCGSARLASYYSHRARAHARARAREFVAIDGEGVTDPITGEHRYVLLSCGEHHISADSAALNFGEIAAFLYSCFEANPRAVYVGFYLSYDFAQWLRRLKEGRVRALYHPEGDAAHGVRPRLRTAAKHLPPFPVDVDGWECDLLPGKRFRLRPRKPYGKEKGKPWLTICDAGSYFQCSFLKAIDPTNNPNPVCTAEEFALIARGKARRAAAEFDPEMVEYNLLECTILARLVAQLAEGMRQEGIRPSRSQWHGPGQLAQLWLRKIKAPTGERVRAIVPEPVREAARASFFGGWFEIFWHGDVPGESFGYDLNSAYPWVISRLPCLEHGLWTHRDWGERGRLLTWAEKDAWAKEGRIGFVFATVEGKHPVVGAMLHRRADRSILRPQRTGGWYVEAELLAAVAAALVDRVRVFESWTYHPCDCPAPIGAIADLYQRRLLVGKASPQGKAMKLVYNACAGKFQQSIGEPAFANPVYATLITSGCRQKITEAIASHPEGARALLMVATDGVAFRTRHPGLDLDETRLGAWTESRHENLSLFMPGFYWDDNGRAMIRRGEVPVFKSRGIAAKDLARHVGALDRAWARMQPSGQWPRAELDVSFQLVSLPQALARGRWDTAGMVVTGGHRIVNANPLRKRKALAPGRSYCWAEGGGVVQEPDKDTGELIWKAGPGVRSLPYNGTFGDELRAFQSEEFGDHPDGEIGDLLAEAWGMRG